MDNKHITLLREISKFCSGLVACDLIVGLWLGSGHYISMFWGIPITGSFIDFWIIIDIFLLAVLLHYGWNITLPASQFKKAVLFVVGCILLAVSLLHLLRIIFNVPVEIGGISIPLWVSVLGSVISGFVGYISFSFAIHNE